MAQNEQIVSFESAGESAPILIIDTNVLLALPRICDLEWGVPLVHIDVLHTVVEELHGLARERVDREQARLSQRARDIWHNLQKRTPDTGLSVGGGKSYLFFAHRPASVSAPLNPDNVDHQQIAFAQQCMEESPHRFCAIVTQDREMADIARAANPPVQVIMPAKYALERTLREQFCRRLEWWGEWRKERGAPNQQAQSLKPPRSPRRRPPDPEARLRRIVRNFYSRIKAARHRAILAIAPLQARLALTAHLVTLLARRPRRIVFLFVEDQAKVRYWAAELRRSCGLSADEVFVFGDRGLPSSKTARVVLYRHDQIETRFNLHGSRMKAGQRLISVIVDSCDLLSPEQLALLLFSDNQFIGYTRYALSHTQSRSGRLLAHFFEQQTILDYAFADAEEDGWLRSFDLIRRPIPWRPEEAQEYAGVNAKYIRAQDKIIRDYPSLGQTSDFWGELHALLDVVADACTADIFRLRERREEMAQIANAKLDTMLDLLAPAGDESWRNIVYDPTGLWTLGLQKTLAARGLEVEMGTGATSDDEWDRVWRRFEAKELHCLLLAAPPPFGLIRSHVNRLIVTTPLTSLARLGDVTDWVLTHAHTFSGRPVEIHLLYVPHTPEEQAMLDFADTVCGLRFNQ